MLKQNLFIILSGILAGAAVMGWMRPDSTSAVTEPVPATDAAVPTSPLAENIDLADAANALDVSNSNILKHLAEAALQGDLSALTSGPKRIPKVTLVSPDKAPGVDHAFIEVPVQTVAQGILALLKNSDQLKDADAIAIVDLVSGNVIAETDGSDAKALINLIQGTNYPAQGSLSDVRNDIFKRWSWHCLNESGSVCLASAHKTPVSVTGASACQFASPATRIVCGTESVPGNSVFNAQNCANAQFEDISSLIADILKAADSGTLGGKTFAKKDLGYGCTLISAIPAHQTAAAAHTVSAPEASAAQPDRSRSLAFSGVVALLTAILVILIGSVCTKRKREEVAPISDKSETKPAASDDSSEKIKKLQSDLDSSQKEVEALKNKLQSQKPVASELSALQSQITQLKDQLDYARKMHKSSELAIQSLEAEKEELKDKLASAIKVSKTQVSSTPKDLLTSNTSKVALESISNLNDQPVKAPVPSTATTKPLPDMSPVLNDVLKSVLEAPGAHPDEHASISPLETTTEDELFPDDGWDDIAASFDAILVDKNKIDKPKDKPAKPGEVTAEHNAQSLVSSPAPDFSLLEDDRSEADLYGMTNFLKSDTRKLISADSEEKQPSRITSHGLGPVPSTPFVAPLKSSAKPSLHSIDALRPIPSLKKADAEPAKVDPSFKPSPSWTGKKAGDTPSSDSNTISQELVNALQRRARDVSQLNNAIPHEDGSSTKSGALDFSRSMSKSGVFSVTGSRAAIDLHSDTEYFKALFDTYIESLKQHGEDTTKFTREQFISRMAKEKETLLKTHKCKDIRFNVVEKNGKTSLKAIPLR